MHNKKETQRIKRHKKMRLRLRGTGEIPRLTVHRSLKNMCAQLIDDTENKTLFSMSTLDKNVKNIASYAGKIKGAQVFGEAFVKMAVEKGITRVIFDRAGYLYHGRIKTFAEALRKGGLIF